MTSSIFRNCFLILILFMARSTHPGYDLCERMEVEVQPSGIVQGWQNLMATCNGGSRTNWGQSCQQTSVACTETDKWLQPVGQGPTKEQEQINDWNLSTKLEPVSNTLHLAISSNFGVGRTTDSFESVPVSDTSSPAMLYQLAQSQAGTTVESDQQRIIEDDNAFAEAKKEGTVEAMQRYIATYPNGIHADEANIILVDLYDDLAYAQTQEEGTILSLARYLILFPEGKYADEVNAEFNKMQEYIAYAKQKLSESTTSNNQVSSPVSVDPDSSEQQGQFDDGTDEFPVGTLFRDCKRCPQLVVVPAGRFTMGSDSAEEGSQSNEQPQHQVTILKPFAVGVFEVTRGEFRAFIEATNYQMGSSCHASKSENGGVFMSALGKMLDMNKRTNIRFSASAGEMQLLMSTGFQKEQEQIIGF